MTYYKNVWIQIYYYIFFIKNRKKLDTLRLIEGKKHIVKIKVYKILL